MRRELRPYAEYAVQLARDYGLDTPTITSVYRTWADQQRLYQRYLSGRSRFPANPPGQSAHNYGLAWDSWVPDNQMPLWIQIRQHVGWGVPSNDDVHAEYPGWRSVIM